MNDELSLLEFRLKYLSEVVDRFAIFESRTTFSGQSKKLLAELAVKRAGIDSSRVDLIEYKFPENLINNVDLDRWPLERYARSQTEKYAEKFGQETNFILSDLDEIPSIEQVKESVYYNSVVSLPTPLYYRFANWKVLHGNKWATAKFVPKKFLLNVNTLRYRKDMRKAKSESGCHFSYLGLTPLDLYNKLQNIAHRELSVTQSEAKLILSYSNFFLIDHLGRFNRRGFGLIKLERDQEFCDVQRKMFQFAPDIFRFEVAGNDLLSRLVASFKLQKAWGVHQFDDLDSSQKHSPDFDFLIHFLQSGGARFLGFTKRAWKRI
jgi:hypothetical protein